MPHTLRKKKGQVTLVLEGELEASEAAALHEALKAAVCPGAALLVKAEATERLHAAVAQVLLAAARTAGSCKVEGAGAGWSESWRLCGVAFPNPTKASVWQRPF